MAEIVIIERRMEMQNVNTFLENAKKNRENYKFQETKEEILDSFNEMIENCKKAKKMLPEAFDDLVNRRKVNFNEINN